MIRYYQYCPIAKAAEILGERWTLLVVREMLMGSRRYNDIRRGVPLISPSVFAQRLKTLEQAGIVERRRDEYCLTEAGSELRQPVDVTGQWGQRWARAQMKRGDLDAAFLMWDIRRNVLVERFPAGRTVVEFEFTDAPLKKRRWWLVVEAGNIDLCLSDPGHEIDLKVTTELLSMTRVWMGDTTVHEALQRRQIGLLGAPRLVRGFADWLKLSPFAGVVRPKKKAGRSAQLRQ